MRPNLTQRGSRSELIPSSGYSAIDFSLLDPHYGTLEQWQQFIDALHARGMYIVLDFTVGTMGDLIGFDK